MIITNNDRKAAYDNVINILLKDNRRYCNSCGKDYRISDMPCCSDPQIGTNADVARAVAEQCRALRESANNDYASNKSKTIRFGISLPVFLYEALDALERRYGRRLLKDDNDINWLARNYPMFAIPRKI